MNTDYWACSWLLRNCFSSESNGFGLQNKKPSRNSLMLADTSYKEKKKCRYHAATVIFWPNAALSHFSSSPLASLSHRLTFPTPQCTTALLLTTRCSKNPLFHCPTAQLAWSHCLTDPSPAVHCPSAAMPCRLDNNFGAMLFISQPEEVYQK
jgi:hypothetical protein